MKKLSNLTKKYALSKVKMKEGIRLRNSGFILLALGFLLYQNTSEPLMNLFVLTLITLSIFLLYTGLIIIPERSTKLSLKYLKECRQSITIMSGIFFGAVILGFMFYPYLTSLDEVLKSLIEKTQDLPGTDLSMFIFLNNMRSAFFGIFAGLVLGIIPIVYSSFNGAMLGYVFGRVFEIAGISEFWRILPHGIFELPAIFISLGLGLHLGLFMFTRSPLNELKRRWGQSINVFLTIIVPLLIIAAIIESALIIFS